MHYKIAVITPSDANDILGDTIIDGLADLISEKKDLEVRIPAETKYVVPKELKNSVVSTKEFIEFAQTADLIFLIWGKRKLNTEIAEKINRWDKTIFIDGAEVGKDRRYDPAMQNIIIHGTFGGYGRIYDDMHKKCAMYFKREKPYRAGVKPLPFGIERKYQVYDSSTKKDIDFFCVFGQEEFPALRKHVREIVQNFCQKNNFTCHTEKTKTKEEFYKLSARSKVGISVGGGGYDTARFWETLGNNALLITEKIDIFEPDSSILDYERVFEFNNLYDLEYYLEKVGHILKNFYNQDNLQLEYEKILANHSSKARVEYIFHEFFKN